MKLLRSLFGSRAASHEMVRQVVSPADDGNMLSYDLAQILVEIFSADWRRFCAFASAARYDDSGASAAQEYLGVDLGEALASLFGQDSAQGWQLDPKKRAVAVERTPG